MITLIKGGYRPATSSLIKIKQPGFKGNNMNMPIDSNQGLTKEYKTWLSLGLATIGAVAIGLIVWIFSKSKKTTNTKLSIQNVKNRLNTDVEMLDKKMNYQNLEFDYFEPNWKKVSKFPKVLAPFESDNEFQKYEIKTLMPYMLAKHHDHILQQTAPYLKYGRIGHGVYGFIPRKGYKLSEIKFSKSRSEIYKEARNAQKEVFVQYLKNRSEYFDKDNEFDVVRSDVLKEPSEDVLDAEILRLEIIRGNAQQFLYTNENSEKDELFELIRGYAEANFAAKMLEEFKPKKENLCESEKKYFSYMNQLGKFWHERLKKEGKEKLEWFEKIQTNEIEAPECYNTGGREFKFILNMQLSKILSNEINKLYESSYIILNDKIISLVSQYIFLNNAVEHNNIIGKYNLKREIPNIISEVLI